MDIPTNSSKGAIYAFQEDRHLACHWKTDCQVGGKLGDPSGFLNPHQIYLKVCRLVLWPKQRHIVDLNSACHLPSILLTVQSICKDQTFRKQQLRPFKYPSSASNHYFSRLMTKWKQMRIKMS
jgi:hypothetical protein